MLVVQVSSMIWFLNALFEFEQEQMFRQTYLKLLFAINHRKD